MSTREILTLQFGHYTNFVGSHFWNIQELSFDYTGTKKTECNHDILYREGQIAGGQVTYTPRLILADLKGSLNSLPATGGLIEETEANDCDIWDQVQKIEEPAPPANDFIKDINSDKGLIENKEYNLESDVRTWTDYLYPRLHPRSINIVNDYSHNSDQASFDIFQIGKTLWKSDYGDTFSDNIRKYVEECDSMQGFQVNFDATDGFSGLALGCIEHLADEYGKTIVSHPIIASHFPDNDPSNQEERDISNLKDSMRLVNFLLGLEELSQHATFFVPMCMSEKGWRKPGNARQFDYVSYKPNLYYHSSALLASAFDTLSLKFRNKSNIYTLSDICADMTGYGRKMAAASLGIPFTFSETKYLIEHLNEVKKPLFTPITPSCKLATDKIFQLITVRGIPENFLKAPVKQAKDQLNLPAYSCNNVKEMFELYFQANNFLSATNVTVSDQPLETKTPFPRIFSQTLNKYGMVAEHNTQEKVESIPVISGYHNGNFMADMIEKLHREVSRIKFGKLHKFTEEGLECEEFKETLDKLSEFKDNYEDNFEL